jgi:hypothetical protein
MAAKHRIIRRGDRTIVVNPYKGVSEIRNRMPSEEAVFAMGLIDKWAMVATQGQNGPAMKPEEAVERAFYIAYLTFKHIKDKRMDTTFPFEKVYGDAEEND